MSREKYDRFEENLNTLNTHLAAMKAEAEKEKTLRDREIFLDGYAVGDRAIREIDSYYTSISTKDGKPVESTLAQAIKVRLDYAEYQFKEIEKIISQNGFKITPRKSSSTNEIKDTTEGKERFQSIMKEASQIFSKPVKRKESSATSTRTAASKTPESNLPSEVKNDPKATAENKEKIAETWEVLKKSPFEEDDEKKNLEDWGEIPMSLIHQSKGADQQLDQKPKTEAQLSESEHTLLNDLRSKVDENKIGFSDLDNLQKLAALDTSNYSVQTKEDVKFILTFANIQLLELSENKPLLMAQSESEIRKLQNTLIQINDKLGLGYSPDGVERIASAKYMDDYNAHTLARQEALAKASTSAHELAASIMLKKQAEETKIETFKSKMPIQQALKNIINADLTGKLQVNQNTLSFELSKLGSLSEKQNFIELAFNHIPKEKPFTDTTINNITILKNEYLKLVVTAVQNGEKVDLDAAKNSPLVNFRNSNLPLPAFVTNIQKTGTRNAIDYVINNKNYIETSSNRESQVHLYSEAPNQRVIKIVHDNLPIINAKEQKPMEAEKSSYKSLQETFENVSKEMKSFLSRGISDQKEKSHQGTSTSTLLRNSDAFHQKIPNNKSIVNAPNRIKHIIATGLATPDEIAENAKNTHPIMHNKVNQLITDFLNHKREFGTAQEKEIYKNMTNDQFIERLLTKRPIVFYDTDDKYMLRNGKIGDGNFESIGTPHQKEPLVIRDYLSYDEMQISALISVSTPTHFINKGNRTNNAVPGAKDSHVKTGVLTGVVGARFEKPGKMEYQHMVISVEQNTRENGYGANNNSPKAKAIGAFAKFYGLEKTGFPTHEEAKNDTSGKYINVGNDKNGNAIYLNRAVYKERMRMSIEAFLDDTNARGEKMNKQADVFVVGLGSGVWAGIEGKSCGLQLENIQLEIYRELLQTKEYKNISSINFSWFKDDVNKSILENDPNLKEKTKFTKDNPADPLSDLTKFRAAMYAWDGNALSAGNEYWLNKKADSGDGAAAACSTLSELQNPEINPQAFKASNIKVYGNAQDNVYAEKVTESTKIDVVKTETKQPEITVGTETEYQKWAKENEEEFNKTLADYEKLMSTASPPRPTQALPILNPKEQETVRSIESRVDNAKKALESASGDRTKMIQALDTIRTLRSEIHALKSETENKPLQEKLSTSDSHLKDAIKDTYEKHKKVDNADVVKSKPAEEKPQIIEATPANKSPEQQQKDMLYQTPTLGHTHK